MAHRVARSIILKEQGDYEGALAQLDEAIRRGEEVARAHYQRGVTLTAMKRVPEAMEAYVSAINARPEYLKALVNLSVLHLERTETAAAAALMKRAERLAAADDPVFICTRAALRRQQGDVVGAIADARFAAVLSPDDARVWEELALCLLSDPRGAEDAVKACARALEIDPARTMAQHHMAAALDQLGRPAEALPHASAALDARPNDPQLQQTKACVLLHLGRAADAIPLLEAVMRARPEHFEAHYNLACGLAKTGRAEDAVPHVERALDLVPAAQRPAFRAHVPNDPDLEALRALPIFRELIARAS
jgi:tetratricopeptide (TPR) repeat protein